MQQTDVLIAGSQGTGLKVVEILEAKRAAGLDDLRLIGFIDDNEDIWGSEFFGYPVFGGPSEIPSIEAKGKLGVICPIGDPVNRYRMLERLKAYDIDFPSAIHPSAQVSARADLGQGNVLSQNVVVQPGAKIGSFNTFNISAVVGPLAIVHDYCTVNALTMIASGADLGSFSYVGMGAKIRERTAVGEGVIVGANAFVNRECEAWTTVIGLPAKKMKDRPCPFSGAVDA